MSEGKNEARKKGKKEDSDLHLQEVFHGWHFLTSDPTAENPQYGSSD